MEILGVGLPEMVFILLLALILLGPKDMEKTGRAIGKWLRKIVTSDGWKLYQQTSREIQTLPNRLMREAALDELREAQGQIGQEFRQMSEAASRTIRPPQAAARVDEAEAERAAAGSPPPPEVPNERRQG